MHNVTVAAVQMQCAKEVQTNIETADRLVRQAAEKGANIILLPELFERPYFCQERQYGYYAYATPTGENEAVRHFTKVSQELGVVLPISFFERDGNVLYNSIAILDPKEGLLGIYRKTHIPDDHFYQEKFYFTPWASAGISGSRNARAPWRCRERSFYSIPRPSAASRCSEAIPCPTGEMP